MDTHYNGVETFPLSNINEVLRRTLQSKSHKFPTGKNCLIVQFVKNEDGSIVDVEVRNVEV